MSVDRGLEHELFSNPRAETALLNKLEAERSSQRGNFDEYQRNLLAIGAGNRQSSASFLYPNRDEAFFKNLNLFRQLKSKVTFVTDFQQPISMPKIKRGDAQIISALEKHDPKDTEYLATIEEFILDKQAHESTIERLNQTVNEIHDEIRMLMLPQILYFLLVYLPPIYAIYQWFNPVNTLNIAIGLGEKLSKRVFEVETEIEQEDSRFYKKWGDKYSEYLLVVNSKKLPSLRKTEKQYNDLLEYKNILTVFVRQSEDLELEKAYQEFKAHPNYIYLFQLCSKLCQYKLEHELKNEHKVLVDQALQALRKLYPEVQQELQQFELTTLANLSESVMFDMLASLYENPIKESHGLNQKIQQAKTKIAKLSAETAKSNPQSNRKEIVENRAKIQKYYDYITQAEQRIAKLKATEKFLQPLKQFLENRTGENLYKLYQFSLNPNNHLHISDLLQKLYPSALRELREENTKTILSNARALYDLSVVYLQQLTRIKQSTDSKLQPYQEVAHALHQLLSTSDWTWEHFAQLETAIQNNPNYYQNKILANLVTEIMTMVAASKLFPATANSIQTQHHIATTAPEVSINQAKSPPTFFQPPVKVSSNANALIKEILGNSNSYEIRFYDDKPSEEDKQEAILTNGGKMVSYIEMLSNEDGSQTISADHVALLRELLPFASRLAQPTNEPLLSEQDFAHAHTLLQQLAREHPVQKGIKFLSKLYTSRLDYMTVTTRFVQEQLRSEIKQEIKDLEKMFEKHRNRRGTAELPKEAQFNLDKWSAARTLHKIIQQYVRQMETHSSPNNADECIKVKQMEETLSRLYTILRYEPRQHATLPALLEQCEHKMEILRDHPACLAAEKAIEALKETKEYEQAIGQSPQPTKKK